jgi:hypothetical protein
MCFFFLSVILNELNQRLTCEQKFEFTPEGISKRAVKTIEFYKDVKPLRSPLDRAFEQLI